MNNRFVKLIITEEEIAKVAQHNNRYTVASLHKKLTKLRFKKIGNEWIYEREYVLKPIFGLIGLVILHSSMTAIRANGEVQVMP